MLAPDSDDLEDALYNKVLSRKESQNLKYADNDLASFRGKIEEDSMVSGNQIP